MERERKNQNNDHKYAAYNYQDRIGQLKTKQIEILFLCFLLKTLCFFLKISKIRKMNKNKNVKPETKGPQKASFPEVNLVNTCIVKSINLGISFIGF